MLCFMVKHTIGISHYKLVKHNGPTLTGWGTSVQSHSNWMTDRCQMELLYELPFVLSTIGAFTFDLSQKKRGKIKWNKKK